MVVLEGLRHEIKGRVVLALDEWRAAPGEHWLVLGPSGSGKTTLLGLIAGLLRPSAGRVLVDGLNLAALPAAEQDRFRGRRIGIVFQTLHLVSALTVEQNLRLAQYLAGLPQDVGRLHEVLAPLDLLDRARAKPRQLSQGEAQRVAIARAVVNRPSLILADEPSSALDDETCRQMIDLLEAQAAACGATLVIATHDQRIRARFDHRLELAPHRGRQP